MHKSSILAALGVASAMTIGYVTWSYADEMNFCLQGAEMEVRFGRDAYGVIDPNNAKAYKLRCYSQPTTYQVNLDGVKYGVYRTKTDAVSEVQAYIALKRLHLSPETVALNLRTFDDRNISR